MARAFTGRKKVFCCGYYGYGTTGTLLSPAVTAVSLEEIASFTSTFDYNDIESVKAAIDEDTACVILEPLYSAAPKDNFLQR